MGEFILELWSFMKERKKFWLLPIVVMLIVLSGLIFLTSGSAVAPFIYTLFLARYAARLVRSGLTRGTTRACTYLDKESNRPAPCAADVREGVCSDSPSLTVIRHQLNLLKH